MSGDERCVHCGHPVRVINYALDAEVMHIQPEASFPTAHKGTAWRHCKGSVATLPTRPTPEGDPR